MYYTTDVYYLFLRESEWIRIQTTSTQKTLLLGQIKMATHNLSTLMYKHLQRRVPAHEAEQTLLQLDKVRDWLIWWFMLLQWSNIILCSLL